MGGGELARKKNSECNRQSPMIEVTLRRFQTKGATEFVREAIRSNIAICQQNEPVTAPIKELPISRKNENSRKSLTCGYLFSARMTGLEPATTGSTVRARQTLTPFPINRLRQSRIPGVVPGVVSNKAKGEFPTPNWPGSSNSGRRSRNTFAKLSGRSSASGRVLPGEISPGTSREPVKDEE